MWVVYLKEYGMAYKYVDVDNVTKEEQKQVIDELKERNVPLAFPIIILDDEQVISGFKKQAIEGAITR